MKYDTRTGGTGGEVAPPQPSKGTPITPDVERKAENILVAQLSNGIMSEATVIAAAAIYLGKRLRSLDTIGV
jgi:hypothetical protein